MVPLQEVDHGLCHLLLLAQAHALHLLDFERVELLCVDGDLVHQGLFGVGVEDVAVVHNAVGVVGRGGFGVFGLVNQPHYGGLQRARNDEPLLEFVVFHHWLALLLRAETLHELRGGPLLRAGGPGDDEGAVGTLFYV